MRNHPILDSMSQHFVLLIHEPAHSFERAVQIHGLPFQISSNAGAGVKLKTQGIPGVRIEAMGKQYRVVDEGGNVLIVRGEPTRSAPLGHGSTFELAGVSVRFFVGTVESLRRTARASPNQERALLEIDLCDAAPSAPPLAAPVRPVIPPTVSPPGATAASEYLARLEDLQRRLAELVPTFAASARNFKIPI